MINKWAPLFLLGVLGGITLYQYTYGEIDPETATVWINALTMFAIALYVAFSADMADATRESVQETRRSADAMEKSIEKTPELWPNITYDTDEKLWRFTIKNYGNYPAKKIKFKFGNTIVTNGTNIKNLEDEFVLPWLAPNEEKKWAINESKTREELPGNAPYNIDLTFQYLDMSDSEVYGPYSVSVYFPPGKSEAKVRIME